MNKCEWCGEEFIPRQDDQRFCKRTCAHSFFGWERREAVRWFRKHRPDAAPAADTDEEQAA